MFFIKKLIKFLQSFETNLLTPNATIPIKTLGKIDTNGLINTGLAMHTARKKEQQPNIVPPINEPLKSLSSERVIASGSVNTAGVKLPKNAVKISVSINKNTNISALATPKKATFFATEFFIMPPIGFIR